MSLPAAMRPVRLTLLILAMVSPVLAYAADARIGLVIGNSDYPTADDAKAAIDTYFKERNAHFRQSPRKAGNKIWRKEREPAAFSHANNCKDPRYR